MKKARIIQAFKHLRRPDFFTGFCITLIIWITLWQADIWTGPKGAFVISQVKHKIDAQIKENANQEDKNNQIYREISSLKKSHEVVETKAREDLGMIKKGEVYYQIGVRKTP